MNARRFAIGSLCAAIVLALFLLSERTASAQAITLPNTYPTRLVNGAVKAGRTNFAQGINHEDCVQDLLLRFELAITGFPPNYQVEAWAGSGPDCETGEGRGVAPAQTAQCWPVMAPFSGTNVSSLTVDVYARDILGHNSGAASPVFDPNFHTSAGAAICDKQTNPAAVPYTIKFMFVQIGDATKVSPGSFLYPPASTDPRNILGVDLLAVPGPKLQRVGIGDGTLNVTWDVNNNSDVAGYRVYCLPGAPAVTGATCTPGTFPTVSTSGSSDAGTTTEGGTVSTSGVNTVDPSLKCAEVDKGASSAWVGNLANGTNYSFTVATIDLYDNVGAASDPVCESPQKTDDFWEKYRAAGGQAGGGCTTTRNVNGASFAFAFALSLLGSVISWRIVRRRRR